MKGDLDQFMHGVDPLELSDEARLSMLPPAKQRVEALIIGNEQVIERLAVALGESRILSEDEVRSIVIADM